MYEGDWLIQPVRESPDAPQKHRGTEKRNQARRTEACKSDRRFSTRTIDERQERSRERNRKAQARYRQKQKVCALLSFR